MMPIQLEVGLAMRQRPRQPRPLFEELPSLDCRMLARRRLFPGNWIDVFHYDNFGLIVPGIRTLSLGRRLAEATLNNRERQTIPIHWQRIGGMCRGSQRPMFVCDCKRRAFRLYALNGHFRCKKCALASGARYACQQVSSRGRAALQAVRLRQFLGQGVQSTKTPSKPTLMHRTTYSRLLGRLDRLEIRLGRKHQGKLGYPVTSPRTMYSTQLARIANA